MNYQNILQYLLDLFKDQSPQLSELKNENLSSGTVQELIAPAGKRLVITRIQSANLNGFASFQSHTAGEVFKAEQDGGDYHAGKIALVCDKIDAWSVGDNYLEIDYYEYTLPS